MLSATWQAFDAVATTMAELLRSAGYTTFTLWARVLLAWLVFVPWGLPVHALWGLDRVRRRVLAGGLPGAAGGGSGCALCPGRLAADSDHRSHHRRELSAF
jgi:hypothetical protein